MSDLPVRDSSLFTEDVCGSSNYTQIGQKLKFEKRNMAALLTQMVAMVSLAPLVDWLGGYSLNLIPS